MTDRHDTTGSLGGRLPLLRPDTLSPTQRRLYEELAPSKQAEADRGGYRALDEDGALIGPFNSYLFVPEISKGYMAWIEAQHAHLPFAADVREAVILTVGASWRAPFELYAHRAVATKAGLPAEAIDRLATGGTPQGLSAEATIAHRFTAALIDRHDVDDALYADAQAAFGDEGLVAMVHLIGLYLSVSAVLTAFRIPAPASD